MRRIAKYHPFLVLLVLGFTVILLSNVVRLDYDQGVGGLAWAVITMILTLPFQIVGTALTALFGNREFLDLLVPIVVSLLMASADVALLRWSKR